MPFDTHANALEFFSQCSARLGGKNIGTNDIWTKHFTNTFDVAARLFANE